MKTIVFSMDLLNSADDSSGLLAVNLLMSAKLIVEFSNLLFFRDFLLTLKLLE